MTKLYSLVNLKDIQREIKKGFIRSTGIQGETFTYTLPMNPEIPRIYTWIVYLVRCQDKLIRSIL